MGRHTIRVPLSESGINDAIQKLTTYQKDIEKKTQILLQELAELGKRVAEETYGYAVNVGVESIENGCRFKVYAEGEMVCFLEFGAGTTTQVRHPFADEVPFDVYPGSWSEQHSKQFSTNGYWYFGNRRYENVEPRPGLYHATLVIQSNFMSVVRKVFN